MAQSASRNAFAHYLRTGRWLREGAGGHADPALETKFNPYHDPRDGRFTFGPAGQAGGAMVKPRMAGASTPRIVARPAGSRMILAGGRIDDGVYRPQSGAAMFRIIQYRPPPRIGSNSGAFYDPLTLDATFPGMNAGPGRMIAAADALVGFGEPGRALTSAMTREYSARLIAEIKAIDPRYHYDSFGLPPTFDGQMRQLNELRQTRAAVLYKVKGQTEPLQVETLRFLHESADKAYTDALLAQRSGRLPTRLSPQEAIGTYVDQRTRINLRAMFSRMGIDVSRGQIVRVNGREYDSSGTDRSYRRPDARIGAVAYDVTIAHKTLKDSQIRGFFASDFRPSHVIIVRPRQLGEHNTYVITPKGR